MSSEPDAPASRLVTLPDGLPSLTLGWEALAFAAEYLVHPNGPRAGQPWRFTREQARFLLWWYAVDDNGRWLSHHGARRLAKGSGKTPMGAVLALIEFCGPVRLDDFDAGLPGGCKGRRVAMPLVQIAAVAEGQTDNTMRMVRALAPRGSRLVTDFQLDPGRTQYNMLPEGSLKVMTSSAATAEGGEATFVLADETEHWLPAKGGPEFHATLVDNLTKSGSRMVEMANAWKPGIGSVAESTFDAWVAQEEGRQRGDRTILYDARLAPPDTDMADPESLAAALDFVYADCPWVDRDAVMTRIWARNARPDDSKRKYLNWPTAPEDAWCDPQAWDKLAAPDRVLVDGEPIVMFFDGSKSRDHTALVACCLRDGHIATLGVWKPGAGHAAGDGDAHAIDVDDIDAAVDLAFDTYDVAAFFADVKEWEGFTKVTWPKRYTDRLHLWAVPGGKQPEPIAWDMRSHGYDFAMAAKLVEAEIRDRSFTHDGNADLARHVRNARRRETRWGAITIRKETPNSPDKIDAAVCMIGARMLYRIATKTTATKRTGEAVFV